jgi:hypothetical protein
MFSNLTFFCRKEWKIVAKVSEKTLHKLLTSFLLSRMLEIKYKIRKASKKCLYAIIIACPMIIDFWKANNYDLATFGESLMVYFPENKGNFTFS